MRSLLTTIVSLLACCVVRDHSRCMDRIVKRKIILEILAMYSEYYYSFIVQNDQLILSFGKFVRCA